MANTRAELPVSGRGPKTGDQKTHLPLAKSSKPTMSTPDFRSLADRISQLVEAHDPSSANAPNTLLELRQAARELEQQCVPP